jgi:small nuclear ribonucleoprotein (snRNP)-like protein
MSQPTISRTLSKAILKPSVRIKLKIWNTYLTGKLVKFDNYMNLIVEDAKEIYFGRGGKRSKDIGTVMIRGASIIFIGQDREKITFAEKEPEKENDEEVHDKLMHRKESEF